MRNVFASLTSRLVITAVLLVATVALLIATAATVALRTSLSDRLDSDVMSSLQRYGPGGRPPGIPGGDSDADNRPDLSRQGTISATYGTGVSLGYLSGLHGRALTTTQIQALTSVTADGRAHDVSIPDLGEYRVAARPANVIQNTTLHRVVLAVGLPTSTVDGPVSQLIAWEALFGLVGIAAAAGAGTYVVRRQLRPLRQVAATANTVARLPLASGAIELAERVPDTLTDERSEVGQVGAALNTLLAHVESSLYARHESEQQVRQFVADASHELRTPLTTIAGYTELARRRPDDVETVRTALGKVEEESGRMTALVEDLLLLARLDAGRPLERRPVDLSRLLVETVSDARVVAPDHRWQLDLPEESVDVDGDAQRLHQVVTNLLTNARKYTPAGTTVTVAATTHGFSVHDDGPGFAPGLAEKAFERFARGDAARNRGSEGGAGLGLSLVDAIVTAHGGSVTLDSRPGSTTVSISLPG